MKAYKPTKVLEYKKLYTKKNLEKRATLYIVLFITIIFIVTVLYTFFQSS